MLKRMWTGDLSKEDRKVINSRVIGYNGLQLPPVFKGKRFENILYQCIQNLQKTASITQNQTIQQYSTTLAYGFCPDRINYIYLFTFVKIKIIRWCCPIYFFYIDYSFNFFSDMIATLILVFNQL